MSQENVEIVRAAFEAITGETWMPRSRMRLQASSSTSRGRSVRCMACLAAMRCPAFLRRSTSPGSPFAERQMSSSKLASAL